MIRFYFAAIERTCGVVLKRLLRGEDFSQCLCRRFQLIGASRP